MTAVSRETVSDEDFEVLESRRRRVVRYRGEDLEITPLRVRQFPAFTQALRGAIGDINGLLGDEKPERVQELVMELIAAHTDSLVTACAAATDRDTRWIGDADADEFLELVTAIFAVNLDFFVQRLLPAVDRNVSELRGLLAGLSGVGRTPSSS